MEKIGNSTKTEKKRQGPKTLSFGSIISVVGKTTVEDYGAFSMYTKSPIRTIMKSDQTIIRKNL